MKKYIFLLLLGATFTLNAQEIELNIPIIEQEQSKWCGAAVSQSVIRYLPPHRITEQCYIMAWVQEGSGSNNCCDVPANCNKDGHGIDLYGSIGRTIQGVLSYFGEINSYPYSLKYPPREEIYECLSNNRPLIIGLHNPFYNTGHAVVVRGIHFNYFGLGDYIFYMDPDSAYGGNREVSYLNLISGFNLPYNWDQTLLTCSSSKDDPCNYGGGGGGGGDDPCANCILDPGEETMDCGGTCPPCGYIGNVTDEVMIINTVDLRTVMRAFKRITACVATTVVSGDDVTFITKKTGSIFLLPGFTAEEGSKFSTQMKDLSEYERLCGAICHDHTLTSTHKAFFDYLQIKNLNSAVRIGYNIYKSEGYEPNPIYTRNFDISREGDFVLWNCTDGAGDGLTSIVRYYIKYSIEYCKGPIYISTHNFTVDYSNYKSSFEDPEEPKTPPQFSHPFFSIIPNPNSGVFQLETNFSLSEISNLKISNLMGVPVFEAQNLSSNTIQLQSTVSGLHFVIIILKDGTMLTQKMVVAK